MVIGKLKSSDLSSPKYTKKYTKKFTKVYQTASVQRARGIVRLCVS